MKQSIHNHCTHWHERINTNIPNVAFHCTNCMVCVVC